MNTNYFKYHSRITEYDGIKFDSNIECNRYKQLKEKEEKGLISNLVVHPKYLVLDEIKKTVNNISKDLSPVYYEADFSYKDADGNIHVEDTKGFETPEFIILEKMFEARYPDLILEVLKSDKNEFITREEYSEKKRERLLKLRESRKELKEIVKDWNKQNPDFTVSQELLKASGSSYRAVQRDMKRMREVLKEKKKEKREMGRKK